MDKIKKQGVAILISDKIEFKKRAIKRDSDGHFIILKGRIHQKDINILNIYAPNIGAPKYIRKILENFKKDIDSNTLIVGDFNTLLSRMDRSSKTNYQQGYCGIEQCPRSNGPNQYIEKLSRQISKIHILFKCT